MLPFTRPRPLMTSTQHAVHGSNDRRQRESQPENSYNRIYAFMTAAAREALTPESKRNK